MTWWNQKKQIDELRQTVDTLKRTVSTLEIEWSEMHDRIRRMLAKISRRQQREDEREDTQPGAGGNGQIAGGTAAHDLGSSLTPRQRIIQQQLLEHRKRVAEKGGE